MRKARSHLGDPPSPLGVALLGMLAAITLLGAGCAETPSPGESRPSTPPATDEKTNVARSVCEAQCAHDIRCDGPRTTSCDCGTVRDTGLLREDWAQAQIACLGRSACAAADASSVTDCEREAYRAIGVNPLSLPSVVMRCLERGDTCGGTAVACQRLAALSDSARAQASVCFDRPCDGYARCFRDFLATRVAPEVHAWR